MKRRRWKQEDIDKVSRILSAHPKEYTYADLASIFKCRPVQIQNLCAKFGWKSLIKKMTSYGEDRLRELLQECFPYSIIRGQYCIGERLRVDYYIPDNSTAWEYDGVQHHKEIAFFSQAKSASIDDRQIKDKRKEELCKYRGINLIRISHSEELSIQLIKNKYDTYGPGTGEITDKAALTIKEKARLHQKKAYNDRQEWLELHGIAQEIANKAKAYRRDNYYKAKEQKRKWAERHRGGNKNGNK